MLSVMAHHKSLFYILSVCWQSCNLKLGQLHVMARFHVFSGSHLGMLFANGLYDGSHAYCQ